MKPIMVIGSTCADVIINIDHLPVTEENLRPTKHSLSLGGCAYNVAHIMNLLHAPFTLISPVGGGMYGDYVAEALKRSGLPITVRIPEQENGCCYCLVEASGERTFLSYHGIEYSFQKEWMKPYDFHSYSMVYICGLELEEPTGINLIEYLEENMGPEIFFAPGPRGLMIPEANMDRLMNLHPILHINKQEAYQLSRCCTIEEAAKALNEKTGNTVIITMGEYGAYCLEKNLKSYTIPGISAVVVDTIGAGDSHAGTILAYLCKGFCLYDSIVAANKVSSAVVGIEGASLSESQLNCALLS